MTWYVALPSDPDEGNEINSWGDYKIIELNDRYLCYEVTHLAHDFAYEWDAEAWLEAIMYENDVEF